MWEFVLYQNAPRPGSWQAEGLTEGEQLAALGSSELFPFRLLITFAATTLVGIWSSCFAAACNTPYSARFSPRCIAHWARSARIPFQGRLTPSVFCFAKSTSPATQGHSGWNKVALLTTVRNSPCSCPFSVSLHPPQAALNSEPQGGRLICELVKRTKRLHRLRGSCL